MDKKLSPYTLFKYWAENPKEVDPSDDILKLSHTHILFYFRRSKYIHFLSDLFNSYYLFSLDKKELFLMAKQIIQRTRFKPMFRAKKKKPVPTSVHLKLKEEYPLLNFYEVSLLYDNLLKMYSEDDIKKSLGVYQDHKKTKTSKKNWNLIEHNKEVIITEKLSSDKSLDELMKNFEIKEI